MLDNVASLVEVLGLWVLSAGDVVVVVAVVVGIDGDKVDGGVDEVDVRA